MAIWRYDVREKEKEEVVMVVLLLTSEEGGFRGALAEKPLVQLFVGKGDETRAVDRIPLPTEMDRQQTRRER